MRVMIHPCSGIVNIFERRDREGGARWQIKAPWARGLRSERVGTRPPKFRLFGWRFFDNTKGPLDNAEA